MVNKIHARRQGKATRAFTLIEVLVVVAIIALLVSILVPSLRKARDQAKAAACASNLGQICRAENVYQSENREWIPGSPWTTGQWFMQLPIAAWDLRLPAFNRLAVNMFDYATPLRALMFGPSSVSRDRKELILEMTDELFSCPANGQIMSKWDGSNLAGPDYAKAVSYVTMTGIMNAGPGKYDEVSNNPQVYRSIDTPGHVAQSRSFSVHAPEGYVPRHNMLGRESMKVFVADGLRFYDGNSITYSTGTTDAKGINCATPPSTGGADWEYGREYNLGQRLSYRHGNNNKMNAGFFDGHVEALLVDAKNSRFRGNAISPKYYYPSKSVVKDPSSLHADDIAAGSLLP